MIVYYAMTFSAASLKPGGFTAFVVTVVRTINEVMPRYIYTCLNYYHKYLEQMGEGSTKQKELKPATIKKLLIPLPPLAEQHRIVAKIEELFPYCHQLIK